MKEDSKEKIDINKEYFNMLYLQFLKAQGIKSYEDFSRHEKEFIDWVSAMYGIKDSYVDLLLCMKQHSGLIGELGKGKFDSIVPELTSKGVDAIAITPYAKTLNSSVEAYEGNISISVKKE